MEPANLSRSWLARTMRLSVFLASPLERVPDDLWPTATIGAPEIEQFQPRQSVRLQAAPWHEGFQLQLVTTQLRFDLTLAAPEDTEAEPPWRPIGSVLPAFVELTRPWLTALDYEVKRLAFGLQAFLKADARTEAYGLLGELLHSVSVEPEVTSDFLYQINRPVKSRAVPDLSLNRLTKWGWLQLRFVRIGVVANDAAQGATTTYGSFVSLECDHNTVQDWPEPLHRDTLAAIYEELVELAWKNMEFGERGEAR